MVQRRGTAADSKPARPRCDSRFLDRRLHQLHPDIPTLRRVEEQFPDKVVVIGIHSPKFANEKSAASVKDAIRRYDIRHPIIHDPQMTIWREYGVQAWPTLVVIGADGNVAGSVPGEPDPDRFVAAIYNLVASSCESGHLETCGA